MKNKIIKHIIYIGLIVIMLFVIGCMPNNPPLTTTNSGTSVTNVDVLPTPREYQEFSEDCPLISFFPVEQINSLRIISPDSINIMENDNLTFYSTYPNSVMIKNDGYSLILEKFNFGKYSLGSHPSECTSYIKEKSSYFYCFVNLINPETLKDDKTRLVIVFDKGSESIRKYVDVLNNTKNNKFADVSFVRSFCEKK